MRIKSWFEEKLINKNVIANCAPYIESINHIEKETEKALLLSVTFGYTNDICRTKNEWIPKSVIITEEEYIKEELEKEKRFKEGCEKYNDLLNFAKSNIKGIRKGMRKETILRKLEENGIVYNEK